MRPPRLFVVADVGGPGHYHLGDEAMLEANLSTFRQLVPGIQFTVPSRDPVWTSRRYGVEALLTREITPGDPEGFEARLRVARASQPSTDPWTEWLGPAIARGLREADGLVISGGGNLCQTWPEKILERAALIQFAKALERPVVVLGQTLGPELTACQRRLLTEALPLAAFVGVRDESSARLAVNLRVPADRVCRQLDDAFFLEPLAVEDERVKTLHLGTRRMVLVTVDASFASVEHERPLQMIASQLDALADCLNASLVFVPHVGGADVPPALADLVAGRQLAAKMRSPPILLDVWQPREVRWLVEQASLVVSTRYHSLVFATSAGIPALGIYTDAYTRTKLEGALTPAGLSRWCLSVADAERGAFLPLALELWHQRKTVSRHLEQLCSDARPREVGRWQAISQALHLKTMSASQNHAPSPRRGVRRADDAETEEDTVSDLLSETEWRTYDEQGYLRLGRVLDEAQLAALRQRMDEIMLGQVRYPRLQLQLDPGGAYEDLPDPVEGVTEATLGYRKIQGLEADPMVLDLMRRDLFREICSRHYGKHASVSIFPAMLMNKPAGQGTHLPWHQDAGDVWKLDRDPLVTLWIALDPSTRRNGCLQIVPGSHRLGLLSSHGSTISARHMQTHCPEEATAYLEVEAGEAILLHNWLLHRSGVNHTDEPRRALTVCYMDGRTLNTLTGNRFPIVFGGHEEADAALPFLRSIKEENRRLQKMAAERETYALSLVEDNQRLEQVRCETERHAKSLEAENQRLQHMRCETERYAKSLEAELARIRLSHTE